MALGLVRTGRSSGGLQLVPSAEPLLPTRSTWRNSGRGRWRARGWPAPPHTRLQTGRPCRRARPHFCPPCRRRTTRGAEQRSSSTRFRACPPRQSRVPGPPSPFPGRIPKLRTSVAGHGGCRTSSPLCCAKVRSRVGTRKTARIFVRTPSPVKSWLSVANEGPISTAAL